MLAYRSKVLLLYIFFKGNSTMSTTRRPMTLHGKDKLDQELKRLIEVERPSIIQAIEEARGHGDLSENADYDAAKERQALAEARIADISDRIANAEVIDPSQIKSDRITFGAFVVLEDMDGNKISYQIVGENESDIKNKKLSINSPLARNLIGKKKGDDLEFKSPKGEQSYIITDFYFK